MSGITPPADAEDAKLSPLERVEAKRAAKKAELRKLWEEQRAIDLEALAELEEAYGDSNVDYLDVPHTPGMVTLIACKGANTAQTKRYRDRIKQKKDGSPGDNIAASEELAAANRIYPADADEYKRLLDTRPGIHTALGVKSINLASARENAEGKG